jgi:RNA recognition motif-containing protein
MRELDRATRTVFLSNLHIKVNEKDLFILFTQKAGKVTDIYIICDRQANKSKGLAYIELETIESMARALGLSGIELYGQPIQVKPSEMEKKRTMDSSKTSTARNLSFKFCTYNYDCTFTYTWCRHCSSSC